MWCAKERAAAAQRRTAVALLAALLATATAQQVPTCGCTTTTTPTPSTSRAATTTVAPRLSCLSVGDLVIVLDASTAVGQASFALAAPAIKAWLDRVAMPPLRVGLVLSSGSGAVEVSALEGSREVLKARLGNATYGGGAPQLAPALLQAAVTLADGRGQVLSATTGARRKMALLIVDGPPLDIEAASTASSVLKQAGVQVDLIWSAGTASPPPAVQNLTSDPSSQHVLAASGYSDLGAALGRLLARWSSPCPCRAGTAARAPAPPGSSLGDVLVLLGRALDSGAQELQDCTSAFRAYSGQLSLTCDSGVVVVDTSGCELACAAGARVNVSADGLSGVVVSSRRLNSSDVAVVPCEDVFGAAAAGSGMVQMQCRKGVVAASHSCGRRCPGATGVEAQYGAATAQLLSPAAGLAHGGWVPARCADLFRGSEGVLALLCQRGELQVLGSCAAPAPSSCPAPRPWWVQGSSLGLWIVAVLAVALGLLLFFAARRVERRPPVKVICEEVLLDVYGPPCKAVEADAEMQTMPIPARESETAECQTLPQVYAELEPGAQVPLDLVCCVDTSFSVGHAGFQRALLFLEQLIDELEMPPARVAALTFNHSVAVASSLEGDRAALLRRLREARYEPGETKLAEALHEASGMLFGSRALHHVGAQARSRAVLVVLDGDPSDMPEAEREALLLRRRGTSIFVVQVGGAASPQVARRLASEPPELASLHLRGFDQLVGSGQRPSDAVSAVLGRLLRVSRRVRRARCTVDLAGAQACGQLQEVTDLDTVPGLEVMPPGWQADGEDSWLWAPTTDNCLASAGTMRWDPSCRPAPPPPPPALTRSVGFQASVAESSIAAQTEPRPLPPRACAEMQTEPMVKVRLGQGRQAPMDLVVCLDNSASFSLSQRADGEELAVGQSAAFRRAKAFVESLARSVHMPEVRIALMRFEEKQDVLCELTGEFERLRAALASLEGSVGITLLAPPLWQALAMLGGGSEAGSSGRCVLVITDGVPSDIDEAKEAARALRGAGAQLLVVRVRRWREAVGLDGDDSGRLAAALHLDELAPPPSPQRRGGAGARASVLPPPVQPMQTVYEVPDDAQAWDALLPTVLRQILRVSRYVARARSTMPLEPYEKVTEEELDEEMGYEVQLPPDPLFDPSLTRWDPELAAAAAPPLDLDDPLAPAQPLPLELPSPRSAQQQSPRAAIATASLGTASSKALAQQSRAASAMLSTLSLADSSRAPRSVSRAPTTMWGTASMSSRALEATCRPTDEAAALAAEVARVDLEARKLRDALEALRDTEAPEVAQARRAASAAERAAEEAEREKALAAFDMEAEVRVAEVAAQATEAAAKEEESRLDALAKRAELAARMREAALLEARAQEAEARAHAAAKQAEEASRLKEAQAEDVQRRLQAALRAAEQAAQDRENAEREHRERGAQLQAALRRAEEAEREREAKMAQEARQREERMRQAEAERQAARQLLEDAERDRESTREATRRAEAAQREADEAKEAELSALRRAEEAERELRAREAALREDAARGESLRHVMFNPTTGKATLITDIDYVKCTFGGKKRDNPVVADFAEAELAWTVLAEVATLYRIHKCNIEVTYNYKLAPTSKKVKEPGFEQWRWLLANDRAECVKRALIALGVPPSRLAMKSLLDAEVPTHVFVFQIEGRQEDEETPTFVLPEPMPADEPNKHEPDKPTLAQLRPDLDSDRDLWALRRQMEAQFADLEEAFDFIDGFMGLKTKRLTQTKFSNCLQHWGISNYSATALFRRLMYFARTKSGDLHLEQFLAAFDEASPSRAPSSMPSRMGTALPSRAASVMPSRMQSAAPSRAGSK